LVCDGLDGLGLDVDGGGMRGQCCVF
jgi:hypothetical protein